MARKLTIHLGAIDEKTIAQICAIASIFAARVEVEDTPEECIVTATEWPHD